MEIEIKDLLYILVMVVGVAGSHFMLRARVMVLEERSRNHGHQFDQILSAIERLEQKIQNKADR
ncbi:MULTISPECIES: hypothetical protein [unclassified Lentilitoribacter]|jgi:hypothetical protein|uniref:hypothetical protein n=1 Tax=unclassified Lentilitoribacter TaxID=2647570 RepID=UPI0013A6CEF7|nr:hypothetical protein [Lentilitoribacter sp. Alg239-R112]